MIRSTSSSSASTHRNLRSNTVCFLALLALGMAIRIPLLAMPGHPIDMQIFSRWANYADIHPVGAIYSDSSCDYGPIYPAVLGFVASMYRAAHPSPSRIPDSVLKIPAVMADILAAICVFLVVSHFASVRSGISGAALLLLNPAFIIASAYWGQVDSLHTVLAALSAYCCTRPGIGSVCLTWILFGCSVMFKLQAIVVAPVILLGQVRTQSARVVCFGVLLCGAVCLALLIPVLSQGTLSRYLDQVVLTALTRYDSITMKAFNLWWLLPREFLRDTVASDLAVGPLSYQCIGLVAFCIIYLVGLARFVTAPASRLTSTALTTSAIGSLAMFLLATQMHERYLLLAIPPLLLSMVYGKHRALCVLLTITASVNLLSVLVRFAVADRGVSVLDKVGGWFIVIGPSAAVVNAFVLCGLVFGAFRKPSR